MAIIEVDIAIMESVWTSLVTVDDCQWFLDCWQLSHTLFTTSCFPCVGRLQQGAPLAHWNVRLAVLQWSSVLCVFRQWGVRGLALFVSIAAQWTQVRLRGLLIEAVITLMHGSLWSTCVVTLMHACIHKYTQRERKREGECVRDREEGSSLSMKGYLLEGRL